MDDEYEKLVRRMNPPRIVVDNDACEHATVIQVDSANKHGILLEVKAYISSDGGWFMDANWTTLCFQYSCDAGQAVWCDAGSWRWYMCAHLLWQVSV